MNLSTPFPRVLSCAAWTAWIVVTASPAVEAQTDYVLTPIATTTTPIPGGSGTFTELGVPSLEAGKVAFRGEGSGSQEGIYVWEGGTVRLVADRNTAVPGGEGTFHLFFEHVSLAENGSVAFVGRVRDDPSGEVPSNGIYTDRDGPLSVLLAPGTVLPGQDHPMSTPNNISYDGVEVAFYGITRVPGELAAEGIYKSDGITIVVIADEHTLHPGRGITFTFDHGGSLALDGGDVVFKARGDYPTGPDPEGVFALIGGRLQVIADADMLRPGTTKKFNGFDGVSMSGGVIAFGNLLGIYRWAEGELETILDDQGSIIPGSRLTFNVFEGTPSVGSNGVGFIAGHWMSRMPIQALRFTLHQGVYIQDASGTLSQIIAWPFPLPYVDFDSGPEGLSGDAFAFRVTLRTGWQGILVATPTAP